MWPDYERDSLMEKIIETWGAVGAVLVICFGAIAMLFRRLDENSRKTEAQLTLSHEQRMKEQQATTLQINSLYESRLKDNENDSVRFDTIISTHGTNMRALVDEISKIANNSNKALWENSTSMNNFAASVREMKQANDDNIRALYELTKTQVKPGEP